MLWKAGKEEGFEEEKLLDWSFLGAMVGLVTGRIGYILTNWPSFGFNLNLWFDFSKHGGFSFVAAVFGAIVVLIFLSQRNRWNFWTMLDLAIFPIIWSQTWVRIGQFLSGTYLGKQTNFILGVSFPGLEGKYLPIQIFEVVFLVIMFFWLKKTEKQYRLFVWYQDKRGEAQPGFVVLVFFLFYSVFRFLLAFMTDSPIYFLSLAFSQWLAFLGIFVALSCFSYKMEKLDDWQLDLGKFLVRRANKQETVLFPREPEPRKKPLPTRRKHIKAGSDVKI